MYTQRELLIECICAAISFGALVIWMSFRYSYHRHQIAAGVHFTSVLGPEFIMKLSGEWMDRTMEAPLAERSLAHNAISGLNSSIATLVTTALAMLAFVLSWVTSASAVNKILLDHVTGIKSEVFLFFKFMAIAVVLQLASIMLFYFRSAFHKVLFLMSFQPNQDIAEYVRECAKAQFRLGNWFWCQSQHLMALSVPLVLWVFGPIPMLAGVLFITAGTSILNKVAASPDPSHVVLG